MNTQAHNNRDDSLKSIKRLATAAMIVGPLSLLVGGVVLSSAGLICAFIAHRKLNKLIDGHPTNMPYIDKTSMDMPHIEERFGDAQLVFQLQRSIKIGLIMCGISLALNAISLYMLLPLLSDMMESGTLDAALTGSSAIQGDVSITWG